MEEFIKYIDSLKLDLNNNKLIYKYIKDIENYINEHKLNISISSLFNKSNNIDNIINNFLELKPNYIDNYYEYINSFIKNESLLYIIYTYIYKDSNNKFNDIGDLFKKYHDNSNVIQYLNDINKYEILSVSELKDNLKSIKNGSNESKNHLINSNLKLVVNIARKYIDTGIDFMDLIEYGNLGLIESLTKLDLISYNSFIPYIIDNINKSIKENIKELELNNNSSLDDFDLINENDCIEEVLNKEVLLNIINDLDKESKYIIKSTYGIDNTIKKNTNELSLILNASLTTIKKKKDKALEVIKNKLLEQDSLNFKKVNIESNKITDPSKLWNLMYKLFKKYKEYYNTSIISPDFKTFDGINYSKDGYRLLPWVLEQYNNNSTSKKDKLNNIGIFNSCWIEYYKNFEDTILNPDKVSNDKKLLSAYWFISQMNYLSGTDVDNHSIITNTYILNNFLLNNCISKYELSFIFTTIININENTSSTKDKSYLKNKLNEYRYKDIDDYSIKLLKNYDFIINKDSKVLKKEYK